MTTAALPSSMGAQMGMAQSQHAAQDVQDKSRAIDSLKRDLHQPKDKAKKLREACEGFESVFIQKMWEQMRATVPKGGMLQGRDEQYWQGMFDQELSKKMSSAGGIGLADMMYEQLSRNLVSATRTTASALGAAGSNTPAAGSGFVASAAPLLPPVEQGTSTSADNAGTKGSGAHAGIYGQEAAQPEAADPAPPPAPVASAATAGTSQSADTPPASTKAQAGSPAQANNTANAAPNTGAPAEVQQVLDQLRAQSAMGTTMTGAQAIAAVQAMTPAQAQALSQGMSWAQVQAMHPTTTGLAAAAGVSPGMMGQPAAAMQAQAAATMQGQPAPTGLDTSRAALQSANTRMPAGGVLPPMTPMQRQARMNYSAATVQGKGISAQSRNPSPVPTVPAAHDNTTGAAGTPAVPQTVEVGKSVHSPVAQQSTMPLNPTLSSNVQGTPGVSPTKFVQNSSLIPSASAQVASAQANPVQANPAQSGAGQATGPAPMSMTGEQIAALAGQVPPAQAGAQAVAQNTATQAPAMGQSQGQPSPAIPPTAQEPQVINTTFTTNIPPSRRNSRPGQRLAKGQPAIRTLNAGGQG